jgi:hypothetical protein
MQIPTFNGGPLSVYVRMTTDEAPDHYYTYVSKQHAQEENLNTINNLVERGYAQVISHDFMTIGQFVGCLCSQLFDVIYTQKGDHFTPWAHNKSIEYIKKYPVCLTFKQDEASPSNQHIYNKEHIPMLQVLPLPRHGESVIVWGTEKKGAQGYGYAYYNLNDAGQALKLQLSDAIKTLAGDSQWGTFNEVQAYCASELEYMARKQDVQINLLHPDAQTRKMAKENLIKLEQTHKQVVDLRQSWLRPDWLVKWQEISSMSQELAKDYYEHHTNTNKLSSSLIPLPTIKSSHFTTMPSIDHFRGLGQSFGPRVAHSLWNTDDAKEQQLQAPNGARLAVRGENGHEQVALHQFVEGGMGVEGIKYMVALLAAYDEQTGSLDRKTDARITLRQMLIFMGKGDHADDLDEQRKLMHYILYLARTWITALDKIQEPVKRRGRPRRGYQEYTPLIVLEALGSDERGGIRIPDMVEFHLGKEYWDQMFGSVKHYFSLPTKLILGYDSKRQSHEICLAFYLTNMINLNFGTFDVNFTTLLIQTGIQDQMDIDEGTHRTRAALRILNAIEQLEIDNIIVRDPHEDIDTALAADFLLNKDLKNRFKLHWDDLNVHERKQSHLSENTYKRLQQQYQHLTTLSENDLASKKREALQGLLERVKHNSIIFKNGTLINQQIINRTTGRQEAIEKHEAAREAARQRQLKKRRKG